MYREKIMQIYSFYYIRARGIFSKHLSNPEAEEFE